LFLGRLIKEKGVENFINLIADIKKHTDIPVIGDIVGGFEKPNYERKIKKIVKAKKLTDTVKFIGEVKYPSSYFQKSHFFIFPSYYGEGVPTVLLESQYCGTPCLASNIAGCREAVLDGVTGRLVSSESAEDWLSEFIKILEDMDYQEMNIQAHKWVSDKFDAEYLSSKTIDWLTKEFETNKGVTINAFLN
jgi:glycosyltransferase involved in cell wall biosynthesis